MTLNASLVSLGAPVTAQTIAASLGGRAAATAVTAPAPALSNGTQVLHIDAESGGYSPSTIAAKAGVPTKLVIRTQDTRSCIVYTVFPSLGLQTALPTTGETEIDLGTLAAGEIPISCSMGMYTGTILVS